MIENPVVYIAWLTLLVAVIEAKIANKRGMSVYSKEQTAVSIGLAIGHILVGMTLFLYLKKLVTMPAEQQLFLLPDGIVWNVMAFFALDFLGYLNHRLSHTISLFWADHAVHHADKEFNVVTNMRHGWTGFVSATLIIGFFASFVGNTSHVLITYYFCAVVVQTFSHTQLVHKMGVLEYFLVTPSNHRVHHAVERSVHDHNYGIVLIIWDKLLGTYQNEGDKQRTKFGLINTPHLNAPLWKHAFFAWKDLLNFKSK